MLYCILNTYFSAPYTPKTPPIASSVNNQSQPWATYARERNTRKIGQI